MNLSLNFLGRLTWLVYIIGAAVGGRVSFNSNDEHDAMDGELVCRVLQLMNLTDARLSQVRALAAHHDQYLQPFIFFLTYEWAQ
jgi:hypothetical protein